MHGILEVNSFNSYLDLAMEIGAEMLFSGAEIYRVEDTISRICKYFGAKETEVFSTTSLIIVTIKNEEIGAVTQSKRINGYTYDLDSVKKYNELSRDICNGRYTYQEIKQKITEIKNGPKRLIGEIALSYAIISMAFTIFFGGVFTDALISGLIGVLMRLFEVGLKKIKVNRFIVLFSCSFLASILAKLFVYCGIGIKEGYINLGNIMILISGLLFTNSIRDMIMENILSGLIKFFEAILIALAIGLGFAMGNALVG